MHIEGNGRCLPRHLGRFAVFPRVSVPIEKVSRIRSDEPCFDSMRLSGTYPVATPDELLSQHHVDGDHGSNIQVFSGVPRALAHSSLAKVDFSSDRAQLGIGRTFGFYE